MSRSIDCPTCQTPIDAPDGAGSTVRCPDCRTRVGVPEPGQKPPRKKKKKVEEPRRSARPLVLLGAGTVLATLAVVGALALAGVLPGRQGKPISTANPAPVKTAPPAPPAPAAPEEADPLRPTDPFVARVAASLDKIAERMPAIPQDAARAKARRAARLEWCRNTTDLAFDRVGRADAPWAAKARRALALRAKTMAERHPFSVGGVLGDASPAALAEAVAAGCDDPLVLYFHTRSRAADGAIKGAEFLAESRRVTGLLWDSRYPDARKLHAAHNHAVLLAHQRGPADEIATWEARCWEAFARVAADPDEFNQEQLIDLAHLREEAAIEAGRTREQGYKAVAAALKKAGAPEYTRLVVEGDFLIRYGWDARGTGTADTVTEEGFRLLHQRLAEAEEALTAAHELAPDRPEAPTLMLTVCMGQSHPRAVMEKWFERAMRAEPDNVSACDRKSEILQPKWGGSSEEVVGFAWQCARTRNGAGLIPFGPAGNIIANATIPDPVTPAALARVQGYYSSPQVWYTLDAALTVVRRDRPELLWVRGWHARVACVAGHYDVAQRELAAIGNDFRGGGFKSAESLNFYKDWAKNARLPQSR